MRHIALPAFVVAAFAWHLLVWRLSPRIGLVKPNFNKTPVPASYGLAAFGYVAALVASLMILGYVRTPEATLYLWVMGAMWALGALDDVFGSRDVGGFVGHFRKLICEHKLTTGAVKALGGGVVGIVAGWRLFGHHPWMWVGTALLIPLAANLLNLFDLRPGRAVAVFFVGLGVTYLWALGSLQAPWVAAVVAAVALVFAIPDSRGRAMMGDSWSNALGAALGITIVLNARVLVAPAIVLIVAIHLYSEKHSISALIERNPVLRTIDRKLGVR